MLAKSRAVAPHLHLAGQAIMHNQAVSHLDPVGLHGVSSPIVVVPNVRIIEVCHLNSIHKMLACH